MPPGAHHEVAKLKVEPGELSFEARIGGSTQPVWLRSQTPVTPSASAALAACLMPAMRYGGTLRMSDPVSPRVLRTQREFQAVQQAWSLSWEFGDPPLESVEVIAPTHVAEPTAATGRVAAFFSGGVDSWATVLDNPDLTDLIFVRGTDILPWQTHQEGLADRVETQLREVADELGLGLHVVETNIREMSDPLARWETYFPSAMVAVAHFLAPLFERVLMASMTDHETQTPIASGRLINQLWSSEWLEIVDDGGRLSREQRVQSICHHPLVQRSLRVCWHNPDGAYNCGRCHKCVLTMISLEACGVRQQVSTFPTQLDLSLLPIFAFNQRIQMAPWEDLLDTIRAARRPDLERPVEVLVARGKRSLGLPASHRTRKRPGPRATTRIAVVIPVWRQARYLAGAIESALAQETGVGVGVVVVDDGCPEPETSRIGQAFRDAHPDRLAFLRQPNSGVSAARNAGIRQAFARWPLVEAIFPLDADNLLSPHTLAELSTRLEREPEAAWASPALEFFGAGEGRWQVPGHFLPYRQLFMNQCDTGSLIRRDVFAAGVWYDETIRYGFEDWEFFLRASLAGFDGLLAGPCGFRYRCRPDSMLAGAEERARRLEVEIRKRHEVAFEPAALSRREHVEAPRFALVRCDRDDALLTANCDLEPRRLSVADLARTIAAAGVADPTRPGHVPPVTVLTTAAAIERLEQAGLLAEVLFDLQMGLRGRETVGLRFDPGTEAEPVGLAIRASALRHLARGHLPRPETTVSVPLGGRAESLSPAVAARAAALIGAAARGKGMPLPGLSHPRFLEHMHIEERRTTFPGSEGSRRELEAGIA